MLNFAKTRETIVRFGDNLLGHHGGVSEEPTIYLNGDFQIVLNRKSQEELGPKAVVVSQGDRIKIGKRSFIVESHALNSETIVLKGKEIN